MEDNKRPRQKSKYFIVRLSTADKIKLENQAKEQNLSMSSYVRTTLLKNKKDE